MNAMILLLASVTVGVDVGWQPLAGGGFEYIIQIEPETLESLKAGNDIISEIPPELVGVRRYRITVGTGPVPRIGTPPEVASGQFRPADQSASSQAEAQGVSSQAVTSQDATAHDPFATSRNPSGANPTNPNAANPNAANPNAANPNAANPNAANPNAANPNAANPNAANPGTAQPDPFAASSTSAGTTNHLTQPANNATGQTNDRYATTATDPFANNRYGTETPSSSTGDSLQGAADSATSRGSGTDGSLLDSVRNRLRENGAAAAPTDSLGNPTANNTTDTPTQDGTVPQMGENPFRDQDRYATNPRYGNEPSRYSAGGGTHDPFGTSGTANSAAPNQEMAAPNDLPPGEDLLYDLPPGEYIMPLPPKTDTSQPSAATNDRYSDRYGDFYNSGSTDSSTGETKNSTAPKQDQQPGTESVADPFDLNRFSDNSTSSSYDETPPPALNPDDNATRLANYRSDEEGPSGRSKKSSSKSGTDAAKPGWMWTILVLAMFASAGANGWLAMLLRDTRRKYADLLERYQHGADEEYDEEYEEEDVHYEAA